MKESQKPRRKLFSNKTIKIGVIALLISIPAAFAATNYITPGYCCGTYDPAIDGYVDCEWRLLRRNCGTNFFRRRDCERNLIGKQVCN